MLKHRQENSINQTSNVVMLPGLKLQNNPYGAEVEQKVAHGPCCFVKVLFVNTESYLGTNEICNSSLTNMSAE